MPEVANPHKKFQFTLNIAGVGKFLAQKVTIPDMEADVVEHGDTNHLIKTPGLYKVGVLTVEQIQDGTKGGGGLPTTRALYDWILACQNPYTGGGKESEIYKKSATVTELDLDGNTPLQTWAFTGVWLSKINGVELSRVDSENSMHTLEFQVDKMFKGKDSAAVEPSEATGPPGTA